MAKASPRDSQPVRAPRERRPYTTPRVIDYGSVAKLTRGSRSVGSDFPQAGFRRRSRCL
jgi:hypothetical protein